MFSSQLTALAYILLTSSCAVVYHDNMGNMSLELKRMKLDGKIVGDSIALLDYDAEPARSELMVRCRETGGIHLLTNRRSFEKFMIRVAEGGPCNITIITLAADRDIDCRETIKMALPATQRFANLESYSRLIRVFHLCSDLKSSAEGQADETPLWLMHRPSSAPTYADPDAALDRVGRDSNSSSFIEALHYVRYRAEDYEKHGDLSSQCSTKCRRSCASKLGPTDRLCERATPSDYHLARAMVISWLIGNVTVEDCSTLSVRQKKLLACDQLAQPMQRPSLIPLALAVPLALGHLLFHVRLAWPNRRASQAERFAAIEGLLATLMFWTRELVAYAFKWPSTVQWQAENQLIKDLVDQRLLSLSLVASALASTNVFGLKLGRFMRVLVVVHLIWDSVLLFKFILDDSYQNDVALEITCQMGSGVFVVCGCFLAANAIILLHVMRTLLFPARDALEINVGRLITKLLIIDGLVWTYQFIGGQTWRAILVVIAFAVELIWASRRTRELHRD